MAMHTHEVAVVEFCDGQVLYGFWAPWLKTLGVPLFSDRDFVQARLDTGAVSSVGDWAEAERSAEAVTVRLIQDGEPGPIVLETTASWSGACVTGPCKA